MRNIFFPIYFISIICCWSQSNELMDKFNEMNNQINQKPLNYLKSIEILNSHDTTFLRSPLLQSFFYQIKANIYSRVGKNKESYFFYRKSKKSFKNISFKNQYVSNRAKKEILDAAAKTQLVMINENHAFPEHRVFTTSLLKGLYKKGYTYLALEDLSMKRVSELNKTNQPKENQGIYINEVMFANMVKRAKEIGFELIAYDENEFFEIHKRDSVGALEIKKIFTKNPQAKVLVHCGFDHINEDKKRLSFFLKRALKIDPLTINQINYTDEEQTVFPCPFRIYPIRKGQKNNYMFDADIQIIHPKYTSQQRPSYLFQNNRVSHKIDLSDIDIKVPYLLEVRTSNDTPDTIPLDRILIDKSVNQITISTLKRGTVFIIKDSSGKIVHTQNIN